MRFRGADSYVAVFVCTLSVHVAPVVCWVLLALSPNAAHEAVVQMVLA